MRCRENIGMLESGTLSSLLLGVGEAMATRSDQYDKNINISLSDSKTFLPQEVRPQTNSAIGVVLLIAQLISLVLLIPMAFVLVSFYTRVAKQRRHESHSTMINAPGTNDEHSLDNQSSPLTTSTFDDADNGQDTCRA